MIAIKSRAENRTDRIKRQQQRTLDEKAEAQSDRAEHVARLRALRLAKEESENEVGEGETAADGLGDDAAPILPVPHRR